MKAPDGAVWIGSDHPFDLDEVVLQFRADLMLADAPERGLFSITADSRYRLWINGRFIARGPERSWPSSMAVDRIDVGHHLEPGLNSIAVEVYCPGYSHFAHVHRAAAGLLAWLECDDRPVLVSGRGWSVRRDPSRDANVRRVSIYGTGVDCIDMGHVEDWQEADVSAWAQARIVQTAEGPIWNRLRARATPLLVEEVIVLDRPWQTRLGPSIDLTDDPHQDLRAAFSLSRPAHLSDMISGGQSAIWIFDLGYSRAALGSVEVTAKGGETLSISYAEKLAGGDLLLSDPSTYCRMRLTDRARLRPGRQRVEAYTMRGGRYLLIRLDTPHDLNPEIKASVRAQHYPLDERPLPAINDPRLGAIAALCRRTILTCLHDGFVDSIWRESSQWLGDVVAEAFALAAISDDVRPLRFAIDMAAEGAAHDGVLPSVLPGDVPAYVVTDYNFSWVELLALYADHPGQDDAAHLLARHWPTLEIMLDHFLGQRSADGLLRSEPGRRLFLDWSAVDRGEPNLTYNLRFLHALRIAARLADRFGQPGAQSYRIHADQLSQAIRTLQGPDGWLENPDGAPASQLALALLILTGLAEGADAQNFADRIVSRSLDSDDGIEPRLVIASPFMHHMVFEALADLNRGDDILAIIRKRWGQWVDEGDVACRENWDISFPDGSACHGFSAHPLGWIARLQR